MQASAYGRVFIEEGSIASQTCSTNP